jgi:secondary thiamine-phosphate synthase enzyme
MPAHIKSTLSGVSINIPITKGKLGLGTWQGIYLMEYRTSQHTRTMTATIQGQPFK